MKKVLLLGDSIRMGYQPYVTQLLEGKAEVVAPEENCRFAKYTLWNVDQWLVAYGTPDVIHWNNGIWDLFHITEEHGVFTPLEEYVTTIRRVLSRLQKSNIPIIWASTTAVHDDFKQGRNAEYDQYNDAITQIMTTAGIPINDLNKLIKGNIGAYVAEDLFHLTEEGSKACAEAVVRAISPYIA